MLEFHNHVLNDILEDPTGGLVILASGLSFHKLLSSLLLLHEPSQGTQLIVSSSSSLKSSITKHSSIEITSITADLPAHHRLALYSSGRISIVTPRILIVDLLSNRVPVSNLAGLILPSVHSVSETSTEGFIVRIVKTVNPLVYVRAFTDRPHAMIAGFSKTERMMRALCVRKLHLWPRFQVYVAQELERDPPEVVDVRVEMSKYMIGIQKAVVEVMDVCLKEMRKTNKVDVEDLTVENALFKSFDEILRRQLDPIWHTLGKKTKQLVSDLKTLRKLLDYLVRYDSVSFLKYLETLRASESFRSVWIFAESSYKIFEYAKKRVYQMVRSDGLTSNLDSKSTTIGKKRKLKRDPYHDKGKEDSGTSLTSTDGGAILEKVLEVAPKWRVLREILEEEGQKDALTKEEDFIENMDSGIILVVCKDDRTCMQLEGCVMNNSQEVMQEEWENYLLGRVELCGLQTPLKKNKTKPKEPKGFGVLDGIVPSRVHHTSESIIVNKWEKDALLAAASDIRNLCKKDRVTEESLHLGIENGSPGLTDSKKEGQPTGNERAVADDIPLDKGFLRRHLQVPMRTQFGSAKQVPPVYFYARESDNLILDILNPTVIIIYHPDMAFVREIEVYKAENASKKLKVYFLFYEGSTEVQKFDASIQRENVAFESLIRLKSTMMISVDQPVLNQSGCSTASFLEPASSVSQNALTRKSGGRQEAKKQMQVIVDMREFMSSLPNVLHQKGMLIIPVTLEVGDYILSPLICVERKSIQDLFMSFTSGRLYNQVETMLHYYRIPILLIEFSQDRSFSFQSASDIGDDITPNSIISKLSLLALHFPRLRIIWSRSVHATAEIFASLKANQDNPDEAKAIRVGVPSDDDIAENDVRAENYNTCAVELLRRLPGVTDANYWTIMNECLSLADLAILPWERLAELMCSQKGAKSLRDFLDAKYPTL